MVCPYMPTSKTVPSTAFLSAHRTLPAGPGSAARPPLRQTPFGDDGRGRGEGEGFFLQKGPFSLPRLPISSACAIRLGGAPLKRFHRAPSLSPPRIAQQARRIPSPNASSMVSGSAMTDHRSSCGRGDEGLFSGSHPVSLPGAGRARRGTRDRAPALSSVSLKSPSFVSASSKAQRCCGNYVVRRNTFHGPLLV